MISSAVIVPEQPAPSSQSDNTSSPTLKRRQSSQSPDSNKRPRLSDQFRHANSSDQITNESVSAPVNSPPPIRRPSSHLEDKSLEAKKRGQRLFGALLGTLSQSSTKPAHRKRDEVERRQLERLRKENEEKEEEKRRQKAELDRVRRKEQHRWEEEGRKIKYANLRAMAGFLRTRTEPKLYYKPWELRPFEKDVIQRQIEEVEELLRSETGSGGNTVSSSRKEVQDIDMDSSPPKTGSHRTPPKLDYPVEDNTIAAMGSTADSNLGNGRINGFSPGDALPVEEGKTEQQNGNSLAPKSSTSLQQIHEHDRGGEELVQGDEDDVIY